MHITLPPGRVKGTQTPPPSPRASNRSQTVAQQCADDARARAPPRKRVCMHVLTLSSLPSPPLPLPPPSMCCVAHTPVAGAGSRRDRRASGLLHWSGGFIHPPPPPPLPPPRRALESCARVYTRLGVERGGGERERRLGRPADTHASPLSSVYAIRYRAVASWNSGSRVGRAREGDVEDS